VLEIPGVGAQSSPEAARTQELRANISFPTRYRFGWGRRAEVGAEARGAGLTRALVVTDPGVAALPWFADTVATLDAAGVASHVVSALSSNPTEVEVSAGVAAYAQHRADGVVAIGGGSAMDAGKAIALLAGHGAGTPGDVAAFALGGARARQIDGARVPPIVAVPTTAGTGSELSTGAVVTDPEAGVKRTMLHASLMPRAVVADAETTVGLPAALTAATGLDALTHALEALCAPSYHPMCDAIALETLRLIAHHLPRATAAPDDAVARGQMLMAAGMAAVAFQKGLGLCHAMAHPLGAVTGLHHGLANAVLLPHVLDVNAEAIAEPCGRLCRALGLREATPVASVRSWVVGLGDLVGLPAVAPLRQTPTETLIARLVPLAQAERLYLATNPTKPTADAIARAYRRALGVHAPAR